MHPWRATPQGVPTLPGRTRADLAWALGYLHGQERFFQMDGQRRTAAGELSDLVGRAALGGTGPPTAPLPAPRGRRPGRDVL